MSVQAIPQLPFSQPAWVIPAKFVDGSSDSSSMIANLCAFYPEDPSSPSGYRVVNRISFPEMEQLLSFVAQREMDPYGQAGNARIVIYVSKALKNRVQTLSKCMVKVLTKTGKILTFPLSVVPCERILELNRKCLGFIDTLRASRLHGLNESAAPLISLIENVQQASKDLFSSVLEYTGNVRQAILGYNVKLAATPERSS